MGGSMITGTRRDNGHVEVAGVVTTKQKIMCCNFITLRIWALTYTVEVARQHYADRRQLLWQAAACLLLAALRMAGGIHHE